jgi:hypothetical protein
MKATTLPLSSRRGPSGGKQHDFQCFRTRRRRIRRESETETVWLFVHLSTQGFAPVSFTVILGTGLRDPAAAEPAIPHSYRHQRRKKDPARVLNHRPLSRIVVRRLSGRLSINLSPEPGWSIRFQNADKESGEVFHCPVSRQSLSARLSDGETPQQWPLRRSRRRQNLR